MIKKNSNTKKKSNSIKLSNLGSISRTLISSLLIVSFFFVIPIIDQFKDERVKFSKEFKNDSKNNFKKTLENKKQSKLSKLDNELNEKYLFEDVFEFNKLPLDTVRLSAPTILQLFKDTNYNLNDVRKKKLVKPVSLTLLPQEMKMIENIKKRKELFIQIILPLVIEENNNIRSDRRTLFSIINKSNNSYAFPNVADKNQINTYAKLSLLALAIALLTIWVLQSFMH